MSFKFLLRAKSVLQHRRDGAGSPVARTNSDLISPYLCPGSSSLPTRKAFRPSNTKNTSRKSSMKRLPPAVRSNVASTEAKLKPKKRPKSTTPVASEGFGGSKAAATQKKRPRTEARTEKLVIRKNSKRSRSKSPKAGQSRDSKASPRNKGGPLATAAAISKKASESKNQKPPEPNSAGVATSSSDDPRAPGIFVNTRDKDNMRFSDRFEFKPGDVVVVPRSNEKLTYARVEKIVDPKARTTKVTVAPGQTKVLPMVLLGKLDEPEPKDERAAAKRYILGIEAIHNHCKGPPKSLTPYEKDMCRFVIVYQARKIFQAADNLKKIKDSTQKKTESELGRLRAAQEKLKKDYSLLKKDYEKLKTRHAKLRKSHSASASTRSKPNSRPTTPDSEHGRFEGEMPAAASVGTTTGSSSTTTRTKKPISRRASSGLDSVPTDPRLNRNKDDVIELISID